MKYNRKMVLISFEKFQELKRKSEAYGAQGQLKINTPGGFDEKRADSRTSKEEEEEQGNQQSRVDKSKETAKGGEVEDEMTGSSDSAAKTLSLPTPPAQFVKSFFNKTVKESVRLKNRNKGKYTAQKKWLKLK